MRTWLTLVVPGLAGLGLAAMPPGPAAAQSRVIVPIIVHAPAAASSRASSLHITTRASSPAPGVTTTRVTVRDTTGAGRTLGGAPPLRTFTTVPAGTPSVLITTRTVSSQARPGMDRSAAPAVTRVTVEDVSHANRVLGGPAPTSLQRTAGPERQMLTITSEGPIETPIVILGP